MTGELNSWFDFVARSMLGYVESLKSTYKLALDLIDRGIVGDFVECGVFAGAECASMAKALINSGAGGRKVHLFDSFEGCPPCGPEDVEFVKANIAPGGACNSLSDVQRNMRDWGIPEGLLVYHPGWFADTLPDCDIGPIALLRLDADLYSSTKICLHHLYPKVSRGGWVIVDDFPLSGCRRALHEIVGRPQPVYFQRIGHV